MKDIFGNEIQENVLLRDRFIEPPFSVLDTKTGSWQSRKRLWLALGIKSEVGRKDGLIYSEKSSIRGFCYHRVKEGEAKKMKEQTTSVFDPSLTELMYRWFCPEGGLILDPFAGGSVRGIVANYLGYKYTGIELRREQVESNVEQAKMILPSENQPVWICGDSDYILEDGIKNEYDFIFSCPPYFDLEIYSDDENDLSNMAYGDFLKKYNSIIKKTLRFLKGGCYACFVVGDIRDKDGFYRCFPDMTKMCFISNGAKLYNEAVLLNVVGTASMKAPRIFGSNKKLVKIHQNILIFKKV